MSPRVDAPRFPPAWGRRLAVTIFLLSVAALVLPAWWYDWRGRTHLVPVAIFMLLVSGASLLLDVISRARQSREALDASRIEAVEAASQGRPPGEASWDVARVKLETYLNRNLDQVRAIFWLSTGVMVVGFLIIAGGVAAALLQPEGNTAAACSSRRAPACW
ncbi:MAG: hypothetical protein R3F43_17895 [bacterium]